jgi:hypothetical protein
VTVRFVDHRRHAARERFELRGGMSDGVGDGHDFTLERIRNRFQRGGFFRLRARPLGGA